MLIFDIKVCDKSTKETLQICDESPKAMFISYQIHSHYNMAFHLPRKHHRLLVEPTQTNDSLCHMRLEIKRSFPFQKDPKSTKRYEHVFSQAMGAKLPLEPQRLP